MRIERAHLGIVMLLTLLNFIGCSDFYIAPPPGLASGSSVSAPNYGFADMKARVFDTQCVGCHAAFSSYTSLMASGVIIPGSSAQSQLIQEVRSGAMPVGGAPLSSSDIAALSAWIDEGAPELPPLPTPTPTPTPVPQATPTPTPQTIATFASLSQTIFQPKCISCHSGAGASAGYDLSTYAGAMAKVTAGNPSMSPLYQVLSGGTMPPAGPALDVSVVNQVGAWIQNGALNN